jgi:very-short-patch-repair endonuclease
MSIRIHNIKKLELRRKELRNNLTPAEAKLWTYLQDSKLENRKFRRQHSVGGFILDFYCPSERLCIELDGSVHNSPSAQAYDNARTEFLAGAKIRVIRFENRLVFENPEGVLEEIARNFLDHPPPPP